MVKRPVMTRVRMRPPAEPTCRAMSAETMKMPDPIIDPATIIVESSSPSSRRNPVDLSSTRTAGCVIRLALWGRDGSNEKRAKPSPTPPDAQGPYTQGPRTLDGREAGRILSRARGAPPTHDESVRSAGWAFGSAGPSTSAQARPEPVPGLTSEGEVHGRRYRSAAGPHHQRAVPGCGGPFLPAPPLGRHPENPEACHLGRHPRGGRGPPEAAVSHHRHLPPGRRPEPPSPLLPPT